VPDYPRRRLALLTLAQPLARLPEDVKRALEHKESTYNFGWSHGREKFNGVPDLLKGSFYANPTMDVPTTDPELIRQHPANCSPNIWPPEAALPGFADAFKSLGKLMVEVGSLVATQCDKYVVHNHSHYKPDRMQKIIRTSRAHKARLLHYFSAKDVSNAGGDADWCGWHLDHGSLTGLTSALYTRECKPCSNPDAACGLYIKNRKGEEVKVAIPEDCIAFQIGESSQIHSGGLLVATPHYVKAPNIKLMGDVARNTFAVFMQPEWDEPMDIPKGTDPKVVQAGVQFWRPGGDFSGFMKAKLQEYY